MRNDPALTISIFYTQLDNDRRTKHGLVANIRSNWPAVVSEVQKKMKKIWVTIKKSRFCMSKLAWYEMKVASQTLQQKNTTQDIISPTSALLFGLFHFSALICPKTLCHLQYYAPCLSPSNETPSTIRDLSASKPGKSARKMRVDFGPPRRSHKVSITVETGQLHSQFEKSFYAIKQIMRKYKWPAWFCFGNCLWWTSITPYASLFLISNRGRFWFFFRLTKFCCCFNN